MNRQHPYGGYSAPPPPRMEHGGPGRPPSSSMGGPGPRAGYGQSSRMVPPSQQLGDYAAAPPPPASGSMPPYNPSAGYERAYVEPAYGGPPPTMLPQRDERGPPPLGGGSLSSYGADSGHPPYGGPPIRYETGPPASAGGGAGAYGGGANRFEPNYADPSHQSPQPPQPHVRAYGGGVPNQSPGPAGSFAPSYAGSGGERGDDRQFQPRKRSRMGGEDGGDRGDMSYQHYLHERLKRERPCRTLFVRNIDFNSDATELRTHFESFGELKSWFDLIPKRGIAFISYFDIRSAESARDALQGYRCMGRELDVHFSLPRETEMTKRCDRDKDQGSLSVALRGSPEVPGVEEIRMFFSRYGEVKSIRDYNEQPNSRLVEFYDCRATKAAYDQAIGTSYRGGTWDITFAWDLGVDERLPDMQKHERDKERLRNMGYRPGERVGEDRSDSHERQSSFGPSEGDRSGAPGNMYGARAEGGAGAGGPRGYGGGAGTKRTFDHDDGGAYQQTNEPPMRRWGQPARPAVEAGYGPRRSSNNNNDAPASGPPPYGSPPAVARPPASVTYGGGGVAASGNGASANNNSATDDARLMQAQKVQQLLASLKPAAAPSSNTAAPPPSAAGANTAPAGSASAAPALPSNLAALLQMAQNKASSQSAQR